MATAFDPRNPRIISHYGVPQIVSSYTEADSQSFLAGELVQFNGTSGTAAVKVAITGDHSVAGIALASATNVTSGWATIPVQILGPDDEIYIRVASSSAGATEAANTTCKPGIAYDAVVSSNLWYVDSSDTTNPKFVFIDAVYDANGDATVWGRFKPLYSEVQVTAVGA